MQNLQSQNRWMRSISTIQKMGISALRRADGGIKVS
jgi:hypothetical protein